MGASAYAAASTAAAGGFDFTTEPVGEQWLLRLPYLQTFTAERAAYRNLAQGLKPPLTATYNNRS